MGAVRASLARQSPSAWLTTVRSNAEQGAFVLPMLTGALVDTVIGFALLGAQLLVAGIKAAVAIAGALVGLSLGLPVVAWQVGGMLVDEAQATLAQHKPQAAVRCEEQAVQRSNRA